MALSGGEYERIFRISVTVVHQEHGPHYFSDTMTIHAKSYDVAVRQALGIAISHYTRESDRCRDTRRAIWDGVRP